MPVVHLKKSPSSMFNVVPASSADDAQEMGAVLLRPHPVHLVAMLS